jgi:hypothetical protein
MLIINQRNLNMAKSQSKYEPLKNHLAKKGYSQVPMSFSTIESIIENNLPPSARKHRAWWSNNPSNSVITFAWLNAGYKTAQVDLDGEKLVFIRDNNIEPSTTNNMENTNYDRHPIFGCLKGLITIPDDLDLTEPAAPEWGEIAYGDDE